MRALAGVVIGRGIAGLRRPFVFTLFLAACSTSAEPLGPEDLSDEGYFELAACSASTPPDIDDATRDSLPGPGPYETIDDQWARIARSVPGGWGGYFLVEGRKTIYLQHPEEADAAIEALVAEGVEVRGADVWRADWNFAQLYDWQRYVFFRVGWPDGVTLADIDELRNRLVFGVAGEDRIDEVESALGAAGLPCGLVELTVIGPFSVD